MNLYCPSHKTSSEEYIRNYDLVKWDVPEKEEDKDESPEVPEE